MSARDRIAFAVLGFGFGLFAVCSVLLSELLIRVAP
jgi:hypothetical protein